MPPGTGVFGGAPPVVASPTVSTPAPTEDITPPTVSITAPADGTKVSGSAVALSASASDNVGVTGVQFWINGVRTGTEIGSAPYTLTWDSTTASSGSNSIVALAQDAAGNSATSTAVLITVDNTPPGISGGSPSGSLAYDTTSATLTVSTNKAATCKYGVTPNTAYDTIAGNFSTTGGTTHSSTLSGLSSANSYIYYVRCRDAFGNANVTDYAISFSVSLPGAPTVSLTGPTNGAVVSGTNVALSASASDTSGGGIAGVQFKLDTNTNLGAEVTSAPFSVTWNSTGAADGSHTVIAVARNSAGMYATSTSAAITVDNNPPTVSITAPSSGSTVSGSAVTLSASASDVVGVAGIQFEINGTSIGTEVVSAPYTLTWDSTATSSGSKSIIAVARDTSSHYSTSTPVSFTVDNAPPIISAVASTTADTIATITWTTDEPSTSAVSYGSTAGYGTASTSAALVTSHSITLVGLSAGTAYHFKIISADGLGNAASSSDRTFTTSSTPSIVSASIRTNAPNTTTNAFMGAQIASNPYTYVRIGDKSVVSVNNTRKIYANIGISTSATLPAAINNGRQEQGTGAVQTIRASTITNLSGTALNQSGANVQVDTFNDVTNNVTFSSRGKTYFCIYKLDNTQTPPVVVSRTYAQFLADGGSVTSSIVNGVSVPNTQIAVPDAYVVISDGGTSLTANTPYFWELEQRSPVVAVTSVTVPSNGTVVVNTSNTDAVVAGNVGTIGGATGNTSVNGTWQVASVVANTSITFTAATAVIGSVTGTPTLKFTYPTGVTNSNVTFNPLGDYARASSIQRDVMGSGDWTSIGTNQAVDGGFGAGFAAIIGTDPTGSDNVLVDGDSIAFGVRDGQTDSPAATFAGDSSGNLGAINRALFTAGVPAIRVAVSGMKATNAYTNGDDSFRRFLAGFADVALTEMGHNDVGSYGTYSAAPGFKQVMIDHWNRLRGALRGTAPRVVATTLTPLTAQVGTDHWTSGRNSTYQTITAPWTLAGYVYANYRADLLGSFITGTTGGIDGVIDLAKYVGNLDGSGTIDGYWPVDGVTNYKYTIDGTHPSMDGSVGLANQITKLVLIAAKAVLH